MIADLHVHTKYSCDSEAEMQEYLAEGKKKGVAWICFTDHVDYNKNDYGCGYYSPEKFFREFNALKEENSSEVRLYAGIEFSEPHLYNAHLEELKRYPYDFIIGSVHWIGDMFPCQEVRERYSAKEFYSLYWKEVLNMVKNGGFDCLGHIDFPKRYYKEIYYEEKVITEILQEMLSKDIILEINTSSLRKGLTKTMPDREILQIYKDNGGKYVTIGSDAHDVKDLGADNEAAKLLVQEMGLQEVVFQERKMCICKQF